MTTVLFAVLVLMVACLFVANDRPLPYLWCNVCDGELTETGWCNTCRATRPH